MRILLTTLNAKYIHSNLAIRYLRGMCPEDEVLIQEFTINDRLDMVAGEIFKAQADVVGFSCYIWNIQAILELVDILHQVSPETIVVLGGPEVSYDPGEYLSEAVHFVVAGEGEETFRELIACLRHKAPSERVSDLKQIQGIAFYSAGEKVVNPPRTLIKDLGLIPSPYQSMDGLEHKIAYVESTRGCPFNCQYCLSSTFQGVRYFPFARTRDELKKLVDAGVKQVKFVDRTFNCNKRHTLEVMEFLVEWNPPANFHFEISADLLDEELLTFLKKAPPGLFQFEVGVQSTNRTALELIQRSTNLNTLARNVKEVARGGNILQLLDLIAGLPGEDYASFKNSFNEVYSWNPGKIQLGFLKLLKGSGVRKRAEEWGYKYTSVPPYRVLQSRWLSYQEIMQLETIEDMVDKYFNSGRFINSLAYLVREFEDDPFLCYEKLADFWEEKGYYRQAHNARVLYEILLEFYRSRESEDEPVFAQLLKLDYLLWERPTRIPEWFPSLEIPFFKERVDNFMRRGLPSLLPQFKDLSRREINKAFHVEAFDQSISSIMDIPFSIAPGEPLYLLFYYPGQLIKGSHPGYIPVMI